MARLVHRELPVGSGAVTSYHDAPLRVKAPGGRLDPVMGALYKSREALGFSMRRKDRMCFCFLSAALAPLSLTLPRLSIR